MCGFLVSGVLMMVHILCFFDFHVSSPANKGNSHVTAHVWLIVSMYLMNVLYLVFVFHSVVSGFCQCSFWGCLGSLDCVGFWLFLEVDLRLEF